MDIGAHLGRYNVKEVAQGHGMTAAQIFLGSPKRWAAPKLSQKEIVYLKSFLGPLFIHGSYLLNPASPNPEVREKTIKALQEQLDNAALVGAQGLVVHGGQAGKEGTINDALSRWEECLAALNFSSTLIIENTAGGNAAPGRALPSFARLLKAAEGLPVEYCVDTCHSWAGDFGLASLHNRLVSEIGRPPLVVHMNGSRDAKGCGRDRHANFVPGEEMTDLSLKFAEEANVPLILETPAEGALTDLALLKGKFQ